MSNKSLIRKIVLRVIFFVLIIGSLISFSGIFSGLVSKGPDGLRAAMWLLGIIVIFLVTDWAFSAFIEYFEKRQRGNRKND